MAWMIRFVTGFAVILPTIWVHGMADSQCGIQYEAIPSSHERTTSLYCGLDSFTRFKWWRSTEKCGEFSELRHPCDSCILPVPANDSFLYYCCTPASVTDVVSVSAMNRRCFELEVCTEVVGDSSGTSTVALFNKAVHIFVEMLSNPPPRLINTIVTLFHNRTRTSNISISQVNVVRFGGIRLIWRFVVQVPELSSRPDEALLKLEAHFRHKQFISCGDCVHVVNIPVRRDSVSTELLATTYAGAQTGTELGTEVVLTSSGAELRGYQIGLGVACVLCFLLFLSVGFTIFAAFICGRKRYHMRSLSNTDSGSDPYGVSPTTPGIMDYLPPCDRQDTALSTTSTQPLIVDPQNRNHPLTLAMSGALPHFTCTASNGHTPTTTDCLNTPTPTVQSRLLLETSDAESAPQALSSHGMVTIKAQTIQETGDQPPVYEHVHAAVPLEVQLTDSTTVEV